MIDFIVVAIILLILTGITVNYIKRKKEGKSGGCSCGSSSSSCAGCHHNESGSTHS